MEPTKLLIPSFVLQIRVRQQDLYSTPLLIPVLVLLQEQLVQERFVKVLIDAGGNVNQAKTDGATPLFTASQNNHQDIVQQLLSIPNININQSMNNGASPLLIGTYLGNYECVQHLLHQSTTNTTLTYENKTALQYAQPNERASAWKFLDNRINMEGRAKCLDLLSSHSQSSSSSVSFIHSKTARFICDNAIVSNGSLVFSQ